MFSLKEIQIIRTNSKYTPELTHKIIKCIMELAGHSFALHPNVHDIPKWSEVCNTYIFRTALYHYVLILEWISTGGMRSKTPRKLRNDIIDLSIIVYASFFDGLMTNEQKMMTRYKIGKGILEKLKGV